VHVTRCRTSTDPADERGSAAEFVILTPVVFLLFILAVVVGEWGFATQLVGNAAESGAVAAASVPPGVSPQASVLDAVDATLSAHHLACDGGPVITATVPGQSGPVSVYPTGAAGPGQIVTVSVSCTTKAALLLPGLPGTVTIRGTSTAPVATASGGVPS
jgi:hypothetical protein